MDRSKFCKQFLKRVTQGTFLWNNFKIGPAVPEKKIFKDFLNFVAIATRVFYGIILCEQFWRGPHKERSCQIWSRLAQRFGRRCFKKASPSPLPTAMFFDESKFHNYWKGSPRNNPVEIFQILISDFRGEEFWRISFKSIHCKKSLPPPPPPPWWSCFFDRSQFLEQSLKRVSKDLSCEIILISDNQFQRRRILKNFS